MRHLSRVMKPDSEVGEGFLRLVVEGEEQDSRAYRADRLAEDDCGPNGDPDFPFEWTADKHERKRNPAFNIESAMLYFQKKTCEPLGLPSCYIYEIEPFFARCESPIERLILPWLVFADYMPVHHGRGIVSQRIPPSNERVGVFIVPQVTAGPYRLDFAAVVRFKNKSKIFAFECDGESFHLNKEKDRKRDAFVASKGVITIRASGTDIFNSPAECASRLAAAIREWAVALP